MTTKLCRYCLQVKLIEEFVLSKACLDGRMHMCRACRNLRRRRRYDRAKNTEAVRRYRAKNPEKYVAYQRAYHHVWQRANRAQVTEYQRRYRERKAALAHCEEIIARLKRKYVEEE